MTDSEIIDALGGNSQVAQILKITNPSVSEWRSKGIPEGRLIELAAQIESCSNGRFRRCDRWPDRWQLIWPELAQTPAAPPNPATQPVAIQAV